MSSHSRAPLLHPVQSSESRWSPALITSVITACLSSIQYGYHMAELNAPEKILRVSLDLSDSQVGFITSIFSVGGLISSTVSSSLSTQLGLRTCFILTSISYILGSVIESMASSYSSMLLGRFISGIGGGLAIVFVPLYMNEISPMGIRGFLGSMTQISINLGILFTQVLALRWSDEYSWRRLLWMAALLGLISLICSFTILSESPKWIILNTGDEHKTLSVLSDLRTGPSSSCQDEIDSWKEEERRHNELVRANPKLGRINMLTYLTQPTYENSRTVATFTMIGQQFAGINSVIFYGVQILGDIFPNWAIALNCLISVSNVIITLISSLLLDRLGRKPMLFISTSAMAVCLIGLSIGTLDNLSILTVVSIFAYVSCFALGCGPIPFLLVGEVSQLEVKGIAQSWATDCNWISVFIIGSIFPVLNAHIGGYTYLLFAGVCVGFATFTLTFIPETKGKSSYEEVWAGKSVREE